MSRKSKPISLEDAKQYLKEYNRIHNNIQRRVKNPDDNTDEFLNNTGNAFVFEADDMLTLIKGGAEYITIILGAHDKDEIGSHKAGSFTLMALGYEKDETNFSDQFNQLKIISSSPQAYQYPPKVALTESDINTVRVGIKNSTKNIKENEIIIDDLTGDILLLK